MKNGDEHICIFCGDLASEVEYMVASPDTGAAVCCDCIDELSSTLKEMRNDESVGLLH